MSSICKSGLQASWKTPECRCIACVLDLQESLSLGRSKILARNSSDFGQSYSKASLAHNKTLEARIRLLEQQLCEREAGESLLHRLWQLALQRLTSVDQTYPYFEPMQMLSRPRQDQVRTKRKRRPTTLLCRM